MTAADPLELARRWADAVNSGDPEAVVAASHEDVVIVPRLVGVEGGTYEGHDGVRRWLGQRGEVWADMIGDFDQMRPVADAVIGTGTLRATARGSGLTVDEPIAGLIRFRGGKAYWIGFFRTEAEALEAAGIDG